MYFLHEKELLKAIKLVFFCCVGTGFVKEGILRERSYWKGRYHDMMMLSILKKEYSN